MKAMVGWSDPANCAGHAGGRHLPWKREAFGTEPQHDPSRRTKLSEAFEDRSDGDSDGSSG